MLSDEEKEALEILNNTEWDGFMITIKNLIEKQSKEIEELKEKNKFLNWYFENQKENFIHKDKIKAKIEELDNPLSETFKSLLNAEEPTWSGTIKQFLQSLLEKE